MSQETISHTDIDYPLCDMRAKSDTKQTDVIKDFELLISKEEIPEDFNLYHDDGELIGYHILYAEKDIYDYDIYLNLKSNKFVLPLSKDIIEYFVNEYEIKNIKDIKDTNISFEIESHNKIKIGNSLVSPIFPKNEFITIYSGEPKEEYNSEKLQVSETIYYLKRKLHL